MIDVTAVSDSITAPSTRDASGRRREVARSADGVCLTGWCPTWSSRRRGEAHTAARRPTPIDGASEAPEQVLGGRVAHRARASFPIRRPKVASASSKCSTAAVARRRRTRLRDASRFRRATCSGVDSARMVRSRTIPRRSRRDAPALGRREVCESIDLILWTEYGERLMRPRFGCGLRRSLMEPNTAAAWADIRRTVARGLLVCSFDLETSAMPVQRPILDGRSFQDLRTSSSLGTPPSHPSGPSTTPATPVSPFFSCSPDSSSS